MSLRKYAEGEVLLDEDQKKQAAKDDWTDEDQEELREELEEDEDTE